MMTSWNETKQIENQILGTADPGEALLFDAQLLLDNELADKVITQQKAYEIVKQFGRKQLKKEIEAIQQALFTQPKYIGFSQKIRRLFKKT
ncbi:hypothetical protein [Sphingobacterium sp. HMA12]|uniref:hypothetical protein n=1 Tax=Sphingobacterium sp. HMA12 TaxID=2050894 RepID=UPI0013153883|nr:hypothetical protein [Sphingobacterium sp. HMA12]